jgi:hypothetical protein
VKGFGKWPCTTALCVLAALAAVTPFALVPLGALVLAVTGWALWHR